MQLTSWLGSYECNGNRPTGMQIAKHFEELITAVPEGVTYEKHSC